MMSLLCLRDSERQTVVTHYVNLNAKDGGTGKISCDLSKLPYPNARVGYGVRARRREENEASLALKFLKAGCETFSGIFVKRNKCASLEKCI